MNNLQDYTKTLIPILKSGKVESTYALRLTPMEKYGISEIINFLQMFDDYVFTEELSKKLKVHYHVVLFTKLYEDEVREKIREFLSLYFTEPPKRGDANKQYNLSEIVDLELSLIYILKDGGDKNTIWLFYSNNINYDTLQQLKKKSYKKFSKEDFAKQLEEIKSRFKENITINLMDMMTLVVQLKAEYRQPINMTHIYHMCLSYSIHNKPQLANDYVREFLSRYQ